MEIKDAVQRELNSILSEAFLEGLKKIMII
jgi:hypothetical protein